MYSAAAPHTLLLRVAVKTWPLTAVVVVVQERTVIRHFFFFLWGEKFVLAQLAASSRYPCGRRRGVSENYRGVGTGRVQW